MHSITSPPDMRREARGDTLVACREHPVEQVPPIRRVHVQNLCGSSDLSLMALVTGFYKSPKECNFL